MGESESYRSENARLETEPTETEIRVRRHAGPVSVLLTGFAVLAAVIMLSIAFAPTVQAFASSQTEDYVYDIPSENGAGSNDDESGFAVGDEYPFDLPPPSEERETRSYYTPIEPMVNTAAQIASSMSFTNEETRLVYGTQFGTYTLDKSDPSVLIVADASGEEIGRASFSIDGPFTISCEESHILEADDTRVLTQSIVNLDGVGTRELYVETVFSESGKPKISAWIQLLDRSIESQLSLQWTVTIPFAKISSDGVIYDMTAGSECLRLPTGSYSIDFGDVQLNQLSTRGSIDWSDAGCGEASARRISSGVVVTVLFPVGMTLVDPTIIATSTSNYATSGASFRNTVFFDGTYYFFYHDGAKIVYVQSSDGGHEWSSPLEVPLSTCSGANARSFDVAIQPNGNRIAVCWKDTYIECIDGIIDSSTHTIQWSERDILLYPDNSGLSWFAGVAITEDGTEVVGIVYKYNTYYLQLRTFARDKYSSDFTEVDNPFPDYDWRTTTPHYVSPVLVSAGGGKVALVAMVKNGATSDCRLYWNEYIPAMDQWLNPTSTWQVVLPTDCEFLKISACPGIHGLGVDVELAISRPSEIYNVVLMTEDSTPSDYHYHVPAGASTSWPSISTDLATGMYVTYVRDGEIRYLRRQLDEQWSSEQSLFEYTDPTATFNALTAGEVFTTRHFLAYTDTSGSPELVKFAALPLPTDLVGPYSDPWSMAGVNEGQPFSMGASDMISPGNGLLYFFQTDFVIPGRGTDMTVSRFHSSPQYFIYNSQGKLVPIMYEKFPWCPMGDSWQLNLPWIDNEHLHLWSGTKISLRWDDYWFNSSQGQQFSLFWAPHEYHLYLDGGMKLTFNKLGFPTEIFANFNQEWSAPDIRFYYDGYPLRLSYMVDHLGRTINFAYNPTSGYLSSATYSGQSVQFAYFEGNLTSSTNAAGITTSYYYKAPPLPTTLLTKVCLTDPLVSSYLYEYTDVDVGTESIAYLVRERKCHERETDYYYTVRDGSIKETYIRDGRVGLHLGETQYLFDSDTRSTTVTYFADYAGYPWSDHVPKKRTVSWYSLDGKVSRTETYNDVSMYEWIWDSPPSDPEIIEPDVAVASVDELGNMIYSLGPEGIEAFGSFAGSTTQNAFLRPAMLDKSSSGKFAYEDFSDWCDDGWYHSNVGRAGGAVADWMFEAYGFDATYQELDPSYYVYSGREAFSSKLPINIGEGDETEVVVDFLAFVEDTSGDIKFTLVDEFGNDIIGMRFFGGWIWYWDGYEWTQSDHTCVPMTVYRLTMEVGDKGGKLVCPAECYVNGTEITPLGLIVADDPSMEFKVLVELLGSRIVVIDEVKIFRSYWMQLQGFPVGHTVELYDSDNNLVHREKSDGSQYFGMHLSPTEDWLPHGYFVVRDRTGAVVLFDTFREIWGGDVFTFSGAEYLKSAIQNTVSGLDIACSTILDDADPDPTQYDLYGTWKSETDADFVMSGVEYHHDGPGMGIGMHGYKAKSGYYPTAPYISYYGSFVQWVYLPQDNCPLEIGLRYYYQDSVSSGWSDFAYWGTSDLIQPGGISGVRMGDLPLPGQWVRLQMVAEDIGWNTGKNVRGVEFWRYGGDAYFDLSALKSSSTYDSVKVTGPASGQTVEVKKHDGEVITSGVVNSYNYVWLDLCGAGISQFPLSAHFVVKNSDGSIDYTSPLMRGIFGGSEYTYSRAASPFYTNPEIPFWQGKFNRLPIGTMSYLDDEETKVTETYFKYGFLVGDWEKCALMSQSKTMGPSGWLTTDYEYDNYGNVISVTDPEGAVLHYSYVTDSTYLQSSWMIVGTQNISTKYEYYSSGLLKKETDALLRSTTYEYDSLGRVTKVTYPTVNGQVAFSEFEYDDDNLIMTSYDPIGTARNTYYDELGRVIKEERLDSSGQPYSFREYTYHWTGQVSRVEDSAGRSIWMDYDYYGRTLEILNPDGTSVQTVYDDMNRTISTFDELGIRKDMIYDAAGRLVQSVQYLDGTKIYSNMTYDRMGNLLTVTDCGGQTTEFEYDNLGRLYRTTYPYGVTEQYTYDGASRITNVDRTGTSRDVSYEYDDAGRLLEKRYSSSDYTTYTYDANGNMKTATRYLYVSGAGGTTMIDWYDYDEWNRVECESSTTDTESHVIEYEYDTRNNLIGLNVDDVWFVDYTYDEFNRVETVVKPSTNPRKPPTTFAEFTYDNQDQIQTIEYANGVVTTFTQNESRGWLESLDIRRSSTVYLDLNYERDATGRITSINNDRTYVYDSLGRLRYANDTAAYGLISYTYDTYGNRLTKTWGASSWYYTYDSYKRLLTTNDPDSGTCYYNAETGNLYQWTLYGTSTMTFTHDGDNELVRTVVGTKSWNYWYDASGRRVKAVEEGATEYTVYAGGQPILTIEGTKKITKTYHVYANGLHIAKSVNAKTMYYYHQDHKGSTRLVTDSTGVVVFDTDYLPFGRAYLPDGDEDFLYVDARATPFCDFLHLGERYYDTRLGRFVNPDRVLGSISTPSSMNRWTYCGNDPINRIDRTGADWFSDTWNSICDVGGAVVDATVDLVGDAVEVVVDVVVEVAETACELVDAAVDAAEKLMEEVVEACVNLVEVAIDSCVAIKEAWDNLDSGLKQWIITGVSIAVSFIPVVGPLISCIIDGTFVDMWNAIKSGDWAMLGMCCMAFIPGAKVMKGLKAIGGLGKASRLAAKGAPMMSDATDVLIKKGTKVFRAGAPGKYAHGGSYSLKSMKGMNRGNIIDKCGIDPSKTGNPLTHHFEYVANQDFYAKVGTSVDGTWPELRLMPGQGAEVLDLVEVTKILP